MATGTCEGRMLLSVMISMRTETIHNPDAKFAISPWDVPLFPQFSHMEIVHHESLRYSDDVIINSLISAGYDIHPAVTTFFFGFQGIGFKLERHFPAVTRDEFQIELEDGYLRFRFLEKDVAYLTLFSIFSDRRGKGLARVHFPKLIDGLFRAGIKSVHGKVAPPYSEPANSLKMNKLLNFYVREIGFSHKGNWEISKNSPYRGESAKAGDKSPMLNAQEGDRGKSAIVSRSKAAL